MELRVLKYFLTVAREESISGAAKVLHVTQPTLSRQIQELENEFGKQLFIRGNRKISLTEDGMLLKQRAQEILNLVATTEAQMLNQDDYLSGDIYIGGGESDGMRIVARTIAKMQQLYPDVKFHLHSGKGEDISDLLDKGLLDFGVFIDPFEMSKYDFVQLPVYDQWGLLIKKDHPLAKNETISPNDMFDQPIILSNQDMVKNLIAGWIGGNQRKLNVVATYNLVYNATLLAQEGVGHVLTLDRLVPTIEHHDSLCFRPLFPALKVNLHFAWKKYKLLSKPAECFLKMLKDEIKMNQEDS